MGVYEEFFLGRQSNVVRLELVEISHPAFSRTFRIVRNVVQGVQVVLPAPDAESAFFEFYPLRIKRAGFDGSLDNELTLSFGDVKDIIPSEIRRVRDQDLFTVAPKVRYWVYRSDDLSNALFGPVEFYISAMPYTKKGFTAVAHAPKVNANGTGEMYTLERFPMLRGFL